ncbi:MAG TPA: DEAD/DEAH box helicase [Anaerolineaceae bacterium]|jgi:ATP-dependent RNA helicase DeaD|nr:DEAD/DEAH box helicase [Anaerolineaceae bacterium]
MTENFAALNLRPELAQAVTTLGYTQPTPIQRDIIPLMLAGSDVTGQAQTGTGKTAAFAIPILQQLDPSARLPQALVVAPTRELALQVAEMTQALGQYLEVNVLAIYGGTAYSQQLAGLRNGAHIVVGTPGRLLDLARRGRLDLSAVRFVVLDEADEMLSMGFIEDVEALLAQTPTERQTALFSATLPKRIMQLAENYLRDPKTVRIEAEQVTVSATEQRYYLVNEFDKLAVLTRLFEIENISTALIFTRTRARTGELVNELNLRGFPAEALSGDMSQEARERTMARFRSGHVKVLVATDVAARGLDVEGISHVFNFDLPDEAELFVHRVGRTGRAGRTGIAISLVTPSERRLMREIEHFTKQEMRACSIPTPEEIQAKRLNDLMTKIMMWLKRGRAKEERALVESLLVEGVDPLELAAVALKIARAEEKQRPIASVSPLPEKAVRPERRPRTNAGFARKGDGETRAPAPRREREPRRNYADQPREAGMVRMVLGLGRQDGIRPGDVVGAIAFHADIPGSSLGKIIIQSDRTMVDVPEAYVGKVLAGNGRYKVRQQGFNIMAMD